MKIIILAVVLVLVAGGGAGAYFKFFANPEKKDAQKVEKEPEAILKEMDTFIVNLSDPGGKRYLKVQMKAKLDTPSAAEEFAARNHELRDGILMILSSKEYEDVAKASDKATLKQELMTAINRSMRKGKVQDLYFMEFLIQ